MMTTFKITRGNHWFRPRLFGLWWKKRRLNMEVCFRNDCWYDHKDIDQLDQNKLFGIGFFPSHHKESARFGWRYDKETDKIVISAYCYVDGLRVIEEMCSVPFFKWHKFTILINPKSYFFEVSTDVLPCGKALIQKKHKKKLSFPLGPYFGGNRQAKKDMTIEMKKL